MHAFANQLNRARRTSVVKRDFRTMPNIRSVAYATDKIERNGDLGRYIAIVFAKEDDGSFGDRAEGALLLSIHGRPYLPLAEAICSFSSERPDEHGTCAGIVP